MTEKLRIDIISDVVCPWCVVGYQHLMAAIEDLEMQNVVEIEWQPFVLNPDMPAEGEDLTGHIARKYGSSKAESTQLRERITQLGSDYGFNFDFYEGMKIFSTRDAHVLLDYARQVGKQTTLKLRFFSAYFTEHKDISDREVLIQEAGKIGLTFEQAKNALSDDETRNRVQDIQAQWRQAGVTSVPSFVFNRASALTGAQPKETFKQALRELRSNQKN